MSPKFETRVVHEDDAIVISVSGEIDVAACERLRDAIEPNMGPHETIILDLSGVEFMDSSSLPILVQARGALTVDGGSLNFATGRMLGWRPGAAACRPAGALDGLRSRFDAVPRVGGLRVLGYEGASIRRGRFTG